MTTAPAPKTRRHTLLQIIRGLSMLSLSTLLAMSLSVVTNKLIAVMAGAEGMGLVGIYRNLAGCVGGVLSFGFPVILMQRLSVARSEEETADLLSATALLNLMQLGVLILCSPLAAPFLGRSMFGANWAVHRGEMWIVFAMAFLNIVFQSALSVVKSRSEIGSITAVQLASSFGSLILIVPLLRMGPKGLAVNAGSASLFGLVFALAVIRRRHKASLAGVKLGRAWSALGSLSGFSTLMMIESLVLMACGFWTISLINKNYGLGELGCYNAVTLIIDTLVGLVGGSARTYLLPSLGEMEEGAGKVSLVSHALALCLTAELASGLVFIGAAPLLVRTLFSSQFEPAIPLLQIMSLALPAHALGWVLNSLLMHKGMFRSAVVMDCATSLFSVAAILLCVHSHLSLHAIAWAYVMSTALGSVLYAAAILRVSGETWLDGKMIAMQAGSVALLLIAKWASAASIWLGAAFGAAGVAYLLFLVVSHGAKSEAATPA